MTIAVRLIRTRRKSAWWEPIFDPEKAESFAAGDWSLPELAANLKLFKGQDLRTFANTKPYTPKFRGIRFTHCDFTGVFELERRTIVFEDCQFASCDFGTSTWVNAKFTKCDFERCSFSQSTWEDAEFRRCTWAELGLSGNETVLDNVYIDNPDRFIEAAWTAGDPELLAKRGTSASFQRMRLEETKATVARSVYNSHKFVGDERTFHAACKVYILQSCRSVQAEHAFNIHSQKLTLLQRAYHAWKLAGADLEFAILSLFGLLNDWGLSVSRPLFGLASTFAVFTALFVWIAELDLAIAAEKSFDITTVTGFTRAVTVTDGGTFLALAWLNLVFAILFYTVFFATVVAKISRTR